MDYEWDEDKRLSNIAKHGVDFADAVGVLEDPAALTVEDDSAQFEASYVTLGSDFLGRILYVVWTEPSVDCLRLISARKASPGEARQYQGEPS